MVAINLNPYQGLKQMRAAEGQIANLVAINLNPYQGLKLAATSGVAYLALLQST